MSRAVPGIDDEEIDALARLARLALDPLETATLAGELTEIVGYLAAIARVDVTGVAPWSPPSVVGGASSLRDDAVIGETIPRDEILAGAAATADGLVIVPRFVES